ncbi:MAG: C2 family cysteine protease [Phycisphaerales bacterium]|nr:hypothetical protein [Planctomycetota bacterium]
MISPMTLLLTVLALAAPEKAAPQFIDVVQANFAAWDLDRSGDLSISEIDRLVVAPQLKGDQAAAIAAMKTVRRIGYPAGPYTLANFDAAVKLQQKYARHAADDPADEKGSAFFNGAGIDWQKVFIACRDRIENPERALFRKDRLSLEQIRQGALGDCYFVAMIGNLVYHQPDKVRKMITVQKNGDLRVAFADSETIVMPALTDAEIGVSSSRGEEGNWMAAFEKGFGLLRQAQYPEKYKDGVASDTIGRGGQLYVTIRILTGHESETYLLRTNIERRGDSAVAQLAANPNDLARMVREKIKQPISRKKLIGAGTIPMEDLPPGIPSRHAYAVLGYDPAKDIVTVWNPHRNSFKPAGAPGLKNGYPTELGVFKVPMVEFVQIFDMLEIELDISAVTEGQRSGKTSGGK